MVSNTAGPAERLQEADSLRQEYVESKKKPKAATWLRSTHARAVYTLPCAWSNLRIVTVVPTSIADGATGRGSRCGRCRRCCCMDHQGAATVSLVDEATAAVAGKAGTASCYLDVVGGNIAMGCSAITLMPQQTV